MRRTLLWSCPLLFLLLRLSASLAFEHTIVFPRLLESRDANGQKTLIVNDDITLQLTPSSVFAEEFTVDTVEDGSPVKYYFQGAEYERDLYYDNFHKASLTVNTHNGVQVEGLIGSTLRIKPANPVERSLDGHVAHMLYEVQRKESLTLKEKEFKTTNRNRRDISVPEVDKNTSYPIERRSGSYIAEVYLVVEKYYAKVFKYKESDILKYISRFINAANMYLNTIGSSSITVKVVGLDIRKTKGKFLMRMKKKKDKLLADETLQAFRSSFDKSKEYKEADLFMLMTRLDIAEGDEKSYDESVTGFSMVGGACTMYKAGSFEDEPFTYYGVYAFVREVSHLLGIVDDGKGPYDWIPGNNGAKKCPPTKGYIMGTPNAADPSVQYNHYYYSSCSANQFETFVSIKRNQDCLTTFNYKGPKTKIVPGVLPEDYNMKYFCKIMHDDYENVTYIDDAGRLKNCRFRCASPKDFRGRSVQFDHFMEEGAPCGKSGSRNMVCLKGACRQKK